MAFNALEGNDWLTAFFFGLPSLFPYLTPSILSLMSRNEEESQISKGEIIFLSPYVWDGGGMDWAAGEEKGGIGHKNRKNAI